MFTYMSVHRYSDIDLGMLQMQVLWLLGRKPGHGYELIKQLNEIKPTKVTAGVLYPVLARLEEMKLISARTVGRKRVYHLTPVGRSVMTRSCTEFCRTFEGIFKQYVCERCR